MKSAPSIAELRLWRTRGLLLRFAFVLAGMPAVPLSAQTVYTWQQIRDKFAMTNPTLQAAQANIVESRANEITAYLRPNPDLSLSTDGTQLSRYLGVWRPFAGTQVGLGLSYLVERGDKRNLRFQSARQATEITATTYLDQERGLIFTLRTAFVQTLQAKAVLGNARENLAYWDRELTVNRTRFDAGDIAQVDLNRLGVQRFQFESDLEAAAVNLDTAKIQLRQLLNDSTPIAQFDVTGPYDFAGQILSMEDFQMAALDTRPDLRAAEAAIDKARTDHALAVANGTADPTYSAWVTHNPSFNNPFDNNTLGASINIPLRINDRNQGEKARTQVDIGRTQKLRDAAKAQVLSDVDTAYTSLVSALNLLRTRERYLRMAEANRNTLQFSYQNGGASLLDYLDTEKALRDTQLAFINLVGSYLTAAAQMNMAVGREVIP
jgi:cobalt-zinc-cadmium efflux system outer membrane protein